MTNSMIRTKKESDTGPPPARDDTCLRKYTSSEFLMSHGCRDKVCHIASQRRLIVGVHPLDCRVNISALTHNLLHTCCVVQLIVSAKVNGMLIRYGPKNRNEVTHKATMHRLLRHAKQTRRVHGHYNKPLFIAPLDHSSTVGGHTAITRGTGRHRHVDQGQQDAWSL